MKKILILMGHYLPGYKDGGPVRTVVNLVQNLGSDYHFYILTADRDHGDLQPYPDIQVNEWNQVGQASVYYVPPKGFGLGLIQKLSRGMDLVYCCGPYNDYAINAMLLNRFGKLGAPLVVASMGSFSKGAYAIRGGKKSLFVKLFRMAGLFKTITWSVTSEMEAAELKAVVGEKANTLVAADLPRMETVQHTAQKQKHHINLIFMSRICKKKNLLFAIEILNKVSGSVQFDIYGNTEDKLYWEKCCKALEELPEKVTWRYCGICDSEQVPETFARYDAMLLPTRGENFGHVINESLAAGCYPIISDTTLWLDLSEHNCGAVLPLHDKEGFVQEIDRLTALGGDDFQILSENAQRYIQQKNTQSIQTTGYRTIFNR